MILCTVRLLSPKRSASCATLMEESLHCLSTSLSRSIFAGRLPTACASWRHRGRGQLRQEGYRSHPSSWYCVYSGFESASVLSVSLVLIPIPLSCVLSPTSAHTPRHGPAGPGC